MVQLMTERARTGIHGSKYRPRLALCMTTTQIGFRIKVKRRQRLTKVCERGQSLPWGLRSTRCRLRRGPCREAWGCCGASSS